jgi:hypothetical protein
MTLVLVPYQPLCKALFKAVFKREENIFVQNFYSYR